MKVIDPEEIIATLRLLTALSVFWGLCFWAARSKLRWKWYWRWAAVIGFLILGTLSYTLDGAPPLGTPSLPDMVLWPVNALGGGHQFSLRMRVQDPYFLKVATAEEWFARAMAFQCFFIWRFLLSKRKETAHQITPAEPVITAEKTLP